MARMRPALLVLPIALMPVLGEAASLTETKLTAGDAAASDVFGWGVAIFGTTAIVGARLDDNGGLENSGSAYLFDTTTGAQTRKLTASDASAGDWFGTAVAISGTRAIVGVLQDDITKQGSAYVFDTTTGAQLYKLTASDGTPANGFGTAVAISGTTAIVGAFATDFRTGSAYLFDTTTGTQTRKLTASDGVTFDDFGTSVAISGNIAIVGSLKDDDKGLDSGSAYLFNATTGAQIAKLTASDGTFGDEFGGSVAISGTTAIVGAWGDSDGGSYSGSAYLFDTTTGAQIAKLTASDAAIEDFFGISVAISGTTAIVGADRADVTGKADAGSAYLFDALTGASLGKLTASDASAEDRFGGFVDIFGDTVIVGAPWADTGGLSSSGAAYVFAPATGVPAVPLPAGIWLLGSALGLLTLGRRRSA